MSAKKTTADSIVNTLEWLITAFILAFVFRAFVMEAFRIPTGSMAETLKGAHWQLACPQCGYKYDYNFTQDNSSRFEKGIANLPEAPRCPSCGYFTDFGGRLPISNGDRILVFKSLYQFKDPRRWDVIVFKNPTNPRENYIKRLIALPTETVEIIDGDIYINNQIARKPQKVQNELWMPIYDNDHQPYSPNQGLFNNQHWQQPFVNDKLGRWNISDPNNPFTFTLNSSEHQCEIYYDTQKRPSANNFQAAYAYNRPISYRHLPECSDLKTQFHIDIKEDNSMIAIKLRKYKTVYTAQLNASSETVSIYKQPDGGNVIELISDEKIKFENNCLVEFSNTDHLLTFKVGKSSIEYDLGKNADDLGSRVSVDAPKVAISGQGNLAISGVKIFRDIHYIDSDGGNVIRANQGNPFTLGKDEFFAMGDNSPASFDSRMWNRPGFANPGKEPYREGIVPRDYLVGKAFFVYWPSGFRINANSPIPFFRLPIIPNVGDMKVIVGGKKGY